MAEVSCTEQIARDSKTNFYYSFVFLPKDRREAIFDVYAFCRHVDDIVDEAPGNQAAQELNAWRRGLDACYDGNPEHPIYQRLAKTVRRFNIPREPFHAIIDGCEMDLTKNRYATFAELETYCYNVASAVGLTCLPIFGYGNPAAEPYGVSLGKALQLTNIMRDVGKDIEIGRIYLPQDELERFGVPESDLLERRYSERFRDLMAFQAARAQAYYDAADISVLGPDRWTLFPAEVMGAIYHRLLVQMGEWDYNVFARRPSLSNPRKASIALRIWLRAKTRGLLP